jgi:hypothetical protein
MINNSHHFKRICKALNYSFEEQMKISIALFQSIYSYVKFDNDPKNGHYIPSDISIQKLID